MILVGTARWASGPTEGNPWRPFMVEGSLATHYHKGQHLTTTLLDVYVRWQEAPALYPDRNAAQAAAHYTGLTANLSSQADDDPGEYAKLDRGDG